MKKVFTVVSRIGKLLRASSLAEVLSYCDKYQTEGEGRLHPVIMFDRSGRDTSHLTPHTSHLKPYTLHLKP